jgi:arylsulfatase A-like enzyme
MKILLNDNIKECLINNIRGLFFHYSKTFLLSLPLTMCSGIGNAQEIPNILLIQVDDLGIGDLAVNGNRFIETPNLDKLAGEAVSYKDFYVNALCAPSRASLLTGRDFWKTGVSGVHGGRDYVNLNEVMFPKLLQQSGYVTGMWGKWHCGKTDGYFPWDRGFDEAYYATLYNHFNNVGLLNGERVETKGWASDRITDFAIDFIKRNSKKKFFAYVSFMAPHEPWYAPDEYTEKYTNKGLSKALSTLYGMIDLVDFNVGRLLKTLEESGVDKSTVIFFLSDNGPVQYCSRYGKLSEDDWGLRNPQGLRGSKGTIWENGVKSPLYIRWKGKTVPHTQYGICSITDIFPTILNLAGIDSKKIKVSLDGEDLKPLQPDSFRTKNLIIFRNMHNPRFSEEFAQNGERNLPYYPIDSKIKESLSADDQTISARNDRFKLVHQDSNDFLFDMFLDPRETSAVIDKEDIVEKLKNQSYHWFQELKNEAHAFGGPVHQIGFEGRKQTKIYACSPSEFSSRLDNHGHYLANWKKEGDSVKYKINVCTPGKYQINLVYRIQPNHEYKFTVSAGSDRIYRSLKQIEKDAWFDTLFEQESAYGDMNKIGNAKIGVIQLYQNNQELKIELDEVLVKQGVQADFQLLSINFTKID